MTTKPYIRGCMAWFQTIYTVAVDATTVRSHMHCLLLYVSLNDLDGCAARYIVQVSLKMGE